MGKSNSKSFTLVELLVVATIILFLSGTSLAILVSFKDDRALNSQISLLTHVLEEAKYKASSGDVSLCGTNGMNPTPYINNFSVVVNSSNIQLIPGCTITDPTPINYPIPTNIVFITPTFAVQFDPQSYQAQGLTRRFPIKNTSTGTCKFVQINRTGLIMNGDCSDCITCP